MFGKTRRDTLSAKYPNAIVLHFRVMCVCHVEVCISACEKVNPNHVSAHGYVTKAIAAQSI